MSWSAKSQRSFQFFSDTILPFYFTDMLAFDWLRTSSSIVTHTHTQTHSPSSSDTQKLYITFDYYMKRKNTRKKVLYIEIKCIEEPFRGTILNREKKRREWNLFNKSNRTEFSCGSILSILLAMQKRNDSESVKRKRRTAKSHTDLKTIRWAIYNQKRLFTFIRPKACVSHPISLDTDKIIDLILRLLSSRQNATAVLNLSLAFYSHSFSLSIYLCVYMLTFYRESMTTSCLRLKFKSSFTNTKLHNINAL